MMRHYLAVNSSEQRYKPLLCWHPIADSELDSWNERLLGTAASYVQFPFWNEAYRWLKFKPVYLACTPGQDGSPCAYVCLLSIGVPGYRIGLINNGPVNLLADVPVPAMVLEALKHWASQNGFVFLRFSGFGSELLNQVGPTSRVNAFPFLTINNHPLLVELRESEDEMLAGFQKVARYEIRNARRVGYEITVSDDAKDLEEAWFLFPKLAKRKGFSLRRPPFVWADIIRRASPQKCARLYTARLESRLVQAIIIVRDARMAEYKLGALDVEALSGNPSPSCLLHWHAMRDSYQLGCEYYDLGHPTGAVYKFKRKFRPVAKLYPPPVTLVIKPSSYRLWSEIVLPAFCQIWPQLLSLITRAISSRNSR
jgi:hypothetical protein